MKNNNSLPVSSGIGYAGLQPIRITGEYGDYQNHDINSLLCRVNWVSDTLDYLKRNPQAELINLPEISRYASQLFTELVSQHSTNPNPNPNPNKGALARRLNKLMGLLVENTLRSGQLTHTEVDQDSSYNQAKNLAILFDPYDQLTTWGDQLTVFEAISSNYGNKEQDQIVKGVLNPDRYNYMPAVLEDLCTNILFAKNQMPDSLHRTRLLNIYDMFEQNGYNIKEEGHAIFLERERDGQKLRSLDTVRRQSLIQKLGEQAIVKPSLRLVA